MKAVTIALALAAYTVGTWGYVLIKGYNITLREWVTPLHPYAGTWPPKCVPPGFIFPTSTQPGVDCASAQKGSASQTGSNNPATNRAQRAAQQAHRPLPGGVSGRF